MKEVMIDLIAQAQVEGCKARLTVERLKEVLKREQ